MPEPRDGPRALRRTPQAARARTQPQPPRDDQRTYKTERWLVLRRQVIIEQPLCAMCQSRLTAEMDHIVPLSQGGAPYARPNLRGLCSPCHRERHRDEAA